MRVVELTVALIAIASLSALQLPRPDVVVERIYEGEGAKIEGVGACSITPEKITCWDMNGAPAPEFAERIRSYYLGQPQEVSFKFGKKNRYLLVRTSGTASLYIEGVVQADRTSSNQLNYASNGEPVLHWLGAAVESDRDKAAVRVVLNNLPGPAPVDLPFRPGTKANYDGVTLEVASWAKAKKEQQPTYNPYGGLPPNSELWQIVFGSSTQNHPFSYMPIGKDGKPIQYVDLKGMPVSGVKYLEENPNSNRGYAPGQLQTNSKYRVAYFQPSGAAADGAFTMLSNIDPSQIASIKLSSVRSKTIQIEGFPLDPKQP
jgi:hypothetical protein